jgi:hypothetical protein
MLKLKKFRQSRGIAQSVPGNRQNLGKLNKKRAFWKKEGSF